MCSAYLAGDWWVEYSAFYTVAGMQAAARDGCGKQLLLPSGTHFEKELFHGISKQHARIAAVQGRVLSGGECSHATAYARGCGSDCMWTICQGYRQQELALGTCACSHVGKNLDSGRYGCGSCATQHVICMAVSSNRCA